MGVGGGGVWVEGFQVLHLTPESEPYSLQPCAGSEVISYPLTPPLSLSLKLPSYGHHPTTPNGVEVASWDLLRIFPAVTEARVQTPWS